MKILCIAEKKNLAEDYGNVQAALLGIKPEFDWESTAKSKQYNQIGDIKLVWLDGHAFELAMPDHYLPADIPTAKSGRKIWRSQDLPVVPEQWEILPKVDKARRLAIIEQELKTCDMVYHLGDPDKEGQLLVDECLLYYGYTGPVKRLLINDKNTSKITAAIQNIRDNSEPMFRSMYMWGLARSRYDWLFGLNLTRAMTLRGQELGHNEVLPVGSVQTPLLYVVRERDRVIENFKPIPYFTISAQVKHENGTFKAKWQEKEDQPGLDTENRLIDNEVAKKLVDRLTGKPANITSYSKTKKQTKAPLPFGMNELQMESFKKHGYSAQQTLDAGQKLYDVYKVMSYPRSDSQYLSEAQHAEAALVFETIFKIMPDLVDLAPQLDSSRKSSAFSDKKMEGSPHHAIVPSIPEISVDISTWSKIERDVFELVVRGYLAQFALPYEYHQTSIEVDIDGELFKASGRTPLVQGWKAICPESDDEETKTEDVDISKTQTLPVMANGDAALCETCEQNSQKTKAPPRFDEGMLLDCMANIYKYVTNEAAKKRLKTTDGTDTVGIGSTSTRGPILKEMFDRQLFVPVKEGSSKIMTSPPARALVDALPLEVKDPAQAGIFKMALDKVSESANPDDAFQAFMDETAAWVRELVNHSRTATMSIPVAPGEGCPVCKLGRLRRVEGKDGFFWSCSRWNAEEKCKATFPDKSGKPNFEAPAKTAAPVHNCPNCKTGQLRKVPSKTAGQHFWGCTNFYNTESPCKSSFPDLAGKPNFIKAPAAAKPDAIACPTCKTGSMQRIPFGGKFFWGCSNYRDTSKPCKTSAPDLDGKPNMSAVKKAA